MKTRLTERSERKSLSEFDPHTNYLNMFYIYLLKSDEDEDLYIGFTNNLERRVKEHNNGFVPSTKLRRPFELIYCEGYKSEKDARKRHALIQSFVEHFWPEKVFLVKGTVSERTENVFAQLQSMRSAQTEVS